jgi:deoxyribonuclease IV
LARKRYTKKYGKSISRAITRKVFMTTKKQPFLLGAHISVAGGLDKAFDRAESIGCTTMQIFTKSNRQWFCKPLTDEEIQAFKKRWKSSSINPIIVHAAYLINIASSNPEIAEKSKKALIQELTRCEQLGIPYLVLHPGSNGEDTQSALSRVTKQLDAVLQAVPGKSMILLETMAGQGSNLCATFEELATIYKQVTHKDRIGICFDTCHAFAAGYDLKTKEGYEKTWEQFDLLLGMKLLKAIHLNDSKKELGSRVDRHEHIGKGVLTDEAFRLLLNDKRLLNIPKILETPKDSLAEDLKNMQHIVTLLDQDTKNTFEICVADEISEAKSK